MNTGIILVGEGLFGDYEDQICSGRTVPSSYLSYTNTVTLRFTSDGSVTNYGFLASVQAGQKSLHY